MIDNEGRVIDYLRISITDRCNLRCIYCMPEEGVKNICHEKILSYDEITRICTVLAAHGSEKNKNYRRRTSGKKEYGGTYPKVKSGSRNSKRDADNQRSFAGIQL